MGFIELAKEIFTLTENVAGLKTDLSQLNKMASDHDRRITKLEATGDIIVEKAKVAAMEQMQKAYHVIMTQAADTNKKLDGWPQPEEIQSPQIKQQK